VYIGALGLHIGQRLFSAGQRQIALQTWLWRVSWGEMMMEGQQGSVIPQWRRRKCLDCLPMSLFSHCRSAPPFTHRPIADARRKALACVVHDTCGHRPLACRGSGSQASFSNCTASSAAPVPRPTSFLWHQHRAGHAQRGLASREIGVSCISVWP